MQINLSFDSSVSAAPAGFVTAINYVASLYDQLFTNPVTVTIDVGWGEIDGTKLAKDDLGESEAATQNSYTYTQVRNAFIASAQSAVQKSAYATLPIADPTIAPGYSGGAPVYVVPAEAEALGLISSYSGAVGSVGFSSTADFSYAVNQTPSWYAYDFVAVAEHEISEVLGRVSGVDGYGISPMDLFRYSAPGVFDFTTTPPSPYTTAYFSIDGGNTNLDNWNTVSGSDYGDWSPSAGDDAYLAAAVPGAILSLSQTDLTLMNVLGWDTSGTALVIASGQVETVSAGETFSGTTVLSGGTLVVQHGGIATGTIVNAGGQEYVPGTDDDATVYGFQEVGSGGTVSGASFLDGGGESVLAGGVASAVSIGAGSYQYVETGGTATAVTLIGFQEVDSGGLAENITVVSGACETVASGGSANVVTIALGGYEYVEAGAVAANVSLGGFQEVDSGGSAGTITVSSGACETVEAGGSASAITVSHGGYSYVEGGAVTGATIGGYQQVDAGSVSNVSVASGADENLFSGSTVDTVSVALGGYQFVVSGMVNGGAIAGYQEIDPHGTATGLTVSSGGEQAVLSGGVASNTTIAGGRELVSSGGTLGGTLTFAGSGGRLALGSGAIVSASLSGFGAGDVLNLSAIAFASATLAFSGDTLTVTDGAHSVSLTLLGQYAAAGFSDATNNAGGTVVTYTPPSSAAAMTLAAGH